MDTLDTALSSVHEDGKNTEVEKGKGAGAGAGTNDKSSRTTGSHTRRPSAGRVPPYGRAASGAGEGVIGSQSGVRGIKPSTSGKASAASDENKWDGKNKGQSITIRIRFRISKI